jgi:hypothetical protein
MRELDGHAAVSHLLQCEGDYHWAVRHQDFALPDPPVYGFGWDVENRDYSTFVPDEANPVADTLTSFALEYVMGYSHGEGGGFGTEVDEPAELLRDLEATFPVRTRFGETEVFETDNVLVRLYPSHWGPGRRIVVEVAKPVALEAIPAFLWDHVRNGGSFHGLFMRDDLRARPTPSPLRAETGGDEIPF